MSQSTIAPRKSSPCCIGCVVLLIIAIGVIAALGIYAYRFSKDNISIIDVAGKPDPELNTDPDVLLPATVGDYERISLNDSLENVPNWQSTETSGVQVAVYEKPEAATMTVIAISTENAQQQRQGGFGPLTMGRSKANEPGKGISIKVPFADETIVTWSKSNWTFMVQTSGTQVMEFVEAFQPGGGTAGSGTATGESTGTATTAEETETTTTEPGTTEEPAPTGQPGVQDALTTG